MKPFDLQKALAGEPVVTRDGRKAFVLVACRYSSANCIITGCVDGATFDWCRDGKYHGVDESNLDLFMADPEPVIKEGWVNVYRGKYKPRTIGGIYQTEAEARKQALDDTYITTTKIQWSEK